MTKRIIKFRARTLDGVWFIWNLLDPIDIATLAIKKDTVGRSTGLHDKNGKDVFEGDLVQCVEMHDYNLWAWVNNKPVSLPVFWDDRFASFRVGKFPEDYDLSQETLSAFEVVGNIYENQ